MRHITFAESEHYPVAVLIKTAAFNKDSIVSNYVAPLTASGVLLENIVAFNLKYEDSGKVSAKFMKEYLSELLSVLVNLRTTHLYVADSNYFKTLTGNSKAEQHLGYVLPCKIKGYEQLNIVLGVNYQALIFNPDLQEKLDLSLTTLSSTLAGTNVTLGSTIIHGASYPTTVADIEAALQGLHQYPQLTADIETFSLRFNEAGIGTMAFAWDQHHGLAFPVDYSGEKFEISTCTDFKYSSLSHLSKERLEIRRVLKKFLSEYTGELIWHNACFDIKVLIYQLWMEDALDTKGLLEGLEVLTRSFSDTKIIAYLATNSTAGNVLGLKPLAHEFAGNWGKEDIKDITRIPLPELLQYNLVDTLSTWYVRNKFYPVMWEENQVELYKSLMLSSLKVIIQMELTGMPMCPQTILEVKADLEQQQATHLATIMNNPVVEALNLRLQEDAMQAKNAKMKVKQHALEQFANVSFNPNSGLQLQKLLYDTMGLPVLDYTNTRQPATGADTIEKLIHHASDVSHKEMLAALIGLNKVSKLLSTFIPAFERGIAKGDGMIYLHGSFVLGGTVSGRLSSNSPNLQNIPAGSTFGKLIKSCFMAPKGWLMVGADFASLEDRINALLTQDPAKLRVYTDGYDGHALRTYAYFGDQMPDIVDTVPSINSVADKKSPYYHLRQESKGPTFALTFQGTWMTLVKNLGWPEDKAKRVEANYHALYAESTRWVKARIAQASNVGYAEGAFGLRIRTPLLAQTYLGHKSTPKEAEAEARTLGNAISGQSYGLLNNRAVNAFMSKVWASKHKLSIKPIALIHDASYFIIKDDIEVVEWVNRELTSAMAWQNLPEIAHPIVKLGGDLDIFWPSWANAITLPNQADTAAILAVCRDSKQEYLTKKDKP